jgi:hypothetical protein
MHGRVTTLEAALPASGAGYQFIANSFSKIAFLWEWQGTCAGVEMSASSFASPDLSGFTVAANQIEYRESLSPEFQPSSIPSPLMIPSPIQGSVPGKQTGDALFKQADKESRVMQSGLSSTSSPSRIPAHKGRSKAMPAVDVDEFDF